jgi:hypothetical protein
MISVKKESHLVNTKQLSTQYKVYQKPVYFTTDEIRVLKEITELLCEKRCLKCGKTDCFCGLISETTKAPTLIMLINLLENLGENQKFSQENDTLRRF